MKRSLEVQIAHICSNCIAALRFQPTKRPQISNKAKNKSAFTKAIPPTNNTAAEITSTVTPTQAAPKTTLADWTNDDDDVNNFYQGPKRERGGRKRRKKNKEEYTVVQDWDDIYDPSRPNNYEEYKHSDEKIREVREWKDRLYAHRHARKDSSDLESSDEEQKRPAMSFAPPSGLSFAPPPIEDPASKQEVEASTGDDAYARRLALSQQAPPPPPSSMPPPPPEPAQAGVISRAPVRYSLPEAPADLPATEEELEEVFAAEDEPDPSTSASEEPRNLRPGQKGFAERLMSKYGWTKGSGLGADGSGIINPLRVQVEKRRKKPDSEGGGYADPKGVGKIIGGKRQAGKEKEAGKFGDMSEVIVLRGMVDGMNLDEEVGDGGLMQEIGEECAEKYGRVERVFIDRSKAQAKVFVKFTSQLSGLRVCFHLAPSRTFTNSYRLSTPWRGGSSTVTKSLRCSTMRRNSKRAYTIDSCPQATSLNDSPIRGLPSQFFSWSVLYCH